MIRLSIIIPFYNVEQYIAQCLDSVFDQDIPLDEYEVICVNDGSPDNSREIVLEYMKKYPNLKLIEHEQNRKLGAARNTGRKAAQGTYIWNVDSDDMIAPNCLEKMLRLCEENDLDVLVSKTIYFDDTQQYDQPHFVPLTSVPMKGLDYLSLLDGSQIAILCPVWNKMIKKDFLDAYKIFSPEINMGEDVPYAFTTMIYASKIMVTDHKCYCYRQNPKSLTGNEWTPQVQTLYEKCYQNSKMIYDIARIVPKMYQKVRLSMVSVARYTFMLVFELYNKMSEKEKLHFIKKCRKNFFRNIYVFKLLPKKCFINYIKWIFINNSNKM